MSASKILAITALIEAVLGAFRFVTARLEQKRSRLERRVSTDWELIPYQRSDLREADTFNDGRDADKVGENPPKVIDTHSGEK